MFKQQLCSSLHLRVVLAVDADEGGGTVESGHEGHCRRWVELGRPDDGALSVKKCGHFYGLIPIPIQRAPDITPGSRPDE